MYVTLDETDVRITERKKKSALKFAFNSTTATASTKKKYVEKNRITIHREHLNELSETVWMKAMETFH